MTQTISRLYATRTSAMAAVEDLKTGGFGDDAINVVAPPPPPATDAAPVETPDDTIEASILQAGVPAAHAPIYAEGVRRGETLVSVRAPFGFATRATDILAQHSPTETSLPDDGYERPKGDPATPLSSAMGWKVLSDNPTPLSSFLGWATLSTRRSAPIPDSELVDDPAPFSKRIGMEVLSGKPAILSGHFGWRLLSDNPTPLSTRLGWPVLAKDQNPPPARFGYPLLSDDPAPLSKRFGWRLLSDNPTPLSSRFGWRVLSSDPAPLSSWFRRLMS
jgi:hypothetical protein